MASIALITSLPTCLSCSVLSDWTQLQSLARLDSAYCNRNTRSLLLELLRSDECINNTQFIASDSKVLQWILARGIKVSSISVSVDKVLNWAVLAKYLNQINLHIRTAHIHPNRGIATVPLNNLTDLIFSLTNNSCNLLANNPRLQRLTVYADRRSDAAFSVSLPELKALCVLFSSIEPCLLSMVRMADKLEQLRICYIYRTIQDSTWIQVAQHCPQLHTLCVSSCLSDHVLIEFSRICPQITDLTILYNDMLTDQGVLEITQLLPQLRSLYLHSCDNLTDLSLKHIERSYKTHNVCVKLGGTRSMGMSDKGIQVLREKLQIIGGKLEVYP